MPSSVMLDIINNMLSERCVREIFRPQKVFTKRSLRTVFERLAHASIMKLNPNAMDKVSGELAPLTSQPFSSPAPILS